MHKLEPDRAHAQHRRIRMAHTVNNASSDWVRRSALKEYAICVADELRIVNAMLDSWDDGIDSNVRWSELNVLQMWLHNQELTIADELDACEDKALASRVSRTYNAPQGTNHHANP